jgi:tetratricopeptide (TPR) repeat protein
MKNLSKKQKAKLKKLILMTEKPNQIFVDNFSKAENLFKNKKYLESLKIYENLLHQSPNHVSVMNNVGLIHERLGKYNEAISFYKKCYELMPDQIPIIHNLANAYCKTERYNEALPLLKKIINTGFRHEFNCEKYALCLFYTQTKNETKIFIESVLPKFSENKLLNGLLGKTLLHLNSHSRGLNYIRKSTGFVEFDDKGVKYI